MVVVLLAMAVVGSVAEASGTRSRFVANEIIVKFRAQPGDASEAVTALRDLDPKSSYDNDLEILRGRLGVRDVRPVVRGSGPRRLFPEAASEGSGRLSILQKHLMRRRNRATEPAEAPSRDRIYRIRLDAGAGGNLGEILAAYRSRPDVEYAELNPIISICVAPSDPAYSQQWSLDKIHAADAWDTCRGGSEVVVAIIDTGVDYNHRDLQGNLWVNEAELNGLAGVDDDGNGYVDDVHGWNFADNDSDPDDDHGHGTHCAGIVAAAGNNGLDTAGVCWAARIMSIKVLGADGEGNAADAVPGIYYAVDNGADIISGSWGGPDDSEALRDAVAYAHRQGVLVVAAAGNDNSDALYYPASYPEVIAVAATDSFDRRWYLSNYGSWVDIAAPGRDIVSLSRSVPGFPTASPLTLRLSGTSMAAPHVSGACALLLSANPFLTCDRVQEIITTTGDPMAAGTSASNGRLNVSEALHAAIPEAGALHLDREAYAEEARIGMFLADWHLRGRSGQVVVVEAESGDEEAVVLTETQVSLGVFRGDIAVRNAAATPGDGMLQVQDGQSIVARYLDGDDGLGQVGQVRQATARADFTPPVILDVKIEVRGAEATIYLLTDEPARAEIRYAATPGGPYDQIATEPQSGELHSVDLTGLSPQTTYSFVIAVTDEAGNETTADNAGQAFSFITSGRRRAAPVLSARTRGEVNSR